MLKTVIDYKMEDERMVIRQNLKAMKSKSSRFG
jgi:hypothetical protein